MKKILTTILLLLTMFNLCFAFGWGKKEEKPRLFEELHLSKQQIKLMQEHRKKSQARNNQIHEELRVKFEALEKEIIEDHPDKNKIAKITEEMKVIHNKMLDQHINNLFELKTILTKEQFTKMQKIMKKRGKKRHEKMKRDDRPF